MHNTKLGYRKQVLLWYKGERVLYRLVMLLTLVAILTLVACRGGNPITAEEGPNQHELNVPTRTLQPTESAIHSTPTSTIRPTPTLIPEPALFLSTSLEEADCESFVGFPPDEFTALKVRYLLEDSLPILQNATLVDIWASCIDFYRTPGDPEGLSFPIATGWLYIYRAGGRMLKINVSANGVAKQIYDDLDSFYRDSPGMEGWTVDSDEVIEIVQNLGFPMHSDGGIFRLHMWPINGIDRPAWKIPYHLGAQQVFLVDASTGQILCPIDDKDNYQECVLSPLEPTPSGFQIVTATPGMLYYDVKVNIAPQYYQGDVPFTYSAVVDRQQDMIVAAHIFPGWITRFGYDNEVLRFEGIATTAITSDPETKEILAVAEFDELVSAEGIWVEEIHFINDGVSFRARSFFSFGIGEKENEEVLEGTKQTDYYFYWPVRPFP